MIIPPSLMSHLGVAYLFSYIMEFKIWKGFFCFVLNCQQVEAREIIPALLLQTQGRSLKVEIRGEGDGPSDSGSELYGRGNHKENPLWPKHPSCSCYCNGKRSLTSPADVQPAAY